MKELYGTIKNYFNRNNKIFLLIWILLIAKIMRYVVMMYVLLYIFGIIFFYYIFIINKTIIDRCIIKLLICFKKTNNEKKKKNNFFNIFWLYNGFLNSYSIKSILMSIEFYENLKLSFLIYDKRLWLERSKEIITKEFLINQNLDF